MGDAALTFVYRTYASGAGAMGLGLTLGALISASAPFGDAIEGDPHFLCERERRQIDDESLVGVNSSYFMLERSRSMLARRARGSRICAEPRCSCDH
jgi:hypothetical protein